MVGVSVFENWRGRLSHLDVRGDNSKDREREREREERRGLREFINNP